MMCFLLAFGVSAIFLNCCNSHQLQPRKADLLLLNAAVITLDPRQPSAEAVAVSDGRIAWVGSVAEAKRIFPKPSKTLDLTGAVILPGMIDAHTHLMRLGESFLKLNLKDVNSETEVVEQVCRRAAVIPPGEWILGWGWDEGKWASHYPTNKALNQVAPKNPVFLTGLHGFAAWVNQAALAIAGVDRQTKDPTGGAILHDEKTGDLTGILTNSAQELVARHVPPLSLPQVKDALALAAAECVRNGLTSVHEAGVTPVMLQALRELIREGKMPLRVYVMLDAVYKDLVAEWLAKGPEIDTKQHQLTVRCFKIFADGALGSRGAVLLEPYSDAPQTTGVITSSGPAIEDLTQRALERGFQVATHAIGDAANRFVLDAYEHAMSQVPQAKYPRLRVEHAQVLALADLPRFVKLGVVVSMQPAHATSDMPWAEQRLGSQRIKGAYAWRSVISTGAHVTLNSDFPGETLNPFAEIYAAVTRQDPQGNPAGGWYPQQRLTITEALRGYTLEAAYAGFEEQVKGTIAAGKLADLTVISKDITQVLPAELLSVRVLKTIVGGRIVYSTGKAE